MRTVLVWTDGDANSLPMIRALAAEAARGEIARIHLLNVQRPLSSYAGRFLARGVKRAFLHEEGARALAGAQRILEDARVPHGVHLGIGDPATAIAETAESLRVDQIVMPSGTGLFGTLAARLLLDRVIRRAGVPVVTAVGRRRPAPSRLDPLRARYS